MYGLSLEAIESERLAALPRPRPEFLPIKPELFSQEEWGAMSPALQGYEHFCVLADKSLPIRQQLRWAAWQRDLAMGL